MTTIYLIRHAEAEGNLYRIAQGQHESILTDRGWRQVQALERRFEGVHIDAVYTSDLYRTCATASAICRPRDLKPIRRKDLREICVGDWEQRTWGEIYRRTPAQMADFSTHPERWYVEGAETPAQVRERMLAALQEIAAENDGKTVAVFSHGYAIRMVLAALQGMTLAEAGTTPHGDNTAVSLLEASHGVLRVIWRDDNAHLQTPEFLAGEKVRRRATALEPGLWFVPLDLQAHGAFFEACAAEAWEDAGEKCPFSAQQLLGGVTRRTTLVGVPRRGTGGPGADGAGAGLDFPAGNPAGIPGPGLRRAAYRPGGAAGPGTRRADRAHCAAGGSRCPDIPG